MTRALVVFDPAHRETRRAAEAIAEGIARGGRIVPVLSSRAELSAEKLLGSGVVVLGSPASTREAVRELRGLAGLLRQGVLDRKVVSVFDAGPSRCHGGGVRALVDSLHRVDPALRLAAPGISVGVRGTTHELPEGEVVRCRRFGERLAELARAAGLP